MNNIGEAGTNESKIVFYINKNICTLLHTNAPIDVTERVGAVPRWPWCVSQTSRSMPRSTCPRPPGTTMPPEQTNAAPEMTIYWPTNGTSLNYTSHNPRTLTEAQRILNP